jgi:hypothetical protein
MSDKYIPAQSKEREQMKKLKTLLSCARTTLLLNILAAGFQPEPGSICVRNPAQALRTILAYFHSLPQSPPQNTNWMEHILYAEGITDYAVTGKLFISGEWKIEVTQDVAPLARTVYTLAVFNSRSGWYWKGSVNAGGGIIEMNNFQFLPEQQRGEIEAEFIRKIQIPPPRPGGYGH